MKPLSHHHIHRRRGSIYISVISAATMVAIIGAAALMVVRIQRRSAQAITDRAEARFYARSAVEQGLLWIEQAVDWRQIMPNGIWISGEPLGSGTLSLEVTDPSDGSLIDSQYDPVLVTGIGSKAQARHKTQLTLVPNIRPLEALNTCLHASGVVYVDSGKSITVVGAALSTNSILDNEGTIDGDAEAAAVATTGTITGTLTAPAPSKQMPDSSVFTDYKDKATVIPFPGAIDKVVISPGSNPWGATNADGLYFIDTGGKDLIIKNSRINGTLVVRTDGGAVILDDAVFLHNYRSDYPVLIVEGDVEIKIRSGEYGLSEASVKVNFNPAGSPYSGSWDDDKLDEYPNEIRGLVHVKGSLVMLQTARVRGCVICEGPVSFEELNQIIHDPSLYANPPGGYTFVDGMRISPGSWKQVVD